MKIYFSTPILRIRTQLICANIMYVAGGGGSWPGHLHPLGVGPGHWPRQAAHPLSTHLLPGRESRTVLQRASASRLCLQYGTLTSGS